MPRHDFDLAALYDALDAAREARGWSWAELTRAISGGPRPAGRAVSSSTIRGLRTRAFVEADGVLSMLRWLGRAPESFVGEARPAGVSTLPTVPDGAILRFDTAKIHDAIDRRRAARGLTWTQVASEAGVPASHLRTLARGGRTAFPYVMRLTQWLEQPAADFVRRAAV